MVKIFKVFSLITLTIGLIPVMSACKNNKIVEQKADEMINIETIYWNSTFSIAGYTISFEPPVMEENIIFSVTVDQGTLSMLSNSNGVETVTVGETGTINTDGRIVWRNVTYIDSSKFNYDDIDEAFIDIIVKEDNHIIGYAVVRVYITSIPSQVNSSTYMEVYTGEILISSYFPKQNGEYQLIDDALITSLISKIKEGN